MGEARVPETRGPVISAATRFPDSIPSLPEGHPERSFLEEDPAVLFGPPEAELMTGVWCWPWGKGKRTRKGLPWGQAPRGHPGLRPAWSLMGTRGSVQLGAPSGWEPRGHPGLCPAGSCVARGAWRLSSCCLGAAAWSGRGTAPGPVGLVLLPGRRAGHTSNSTQVASQEFAALSRWGEWPRVGLGSNLPRSPRPLCSLL